MAERQLRRRGIGDERVLAAMASVPRELFVPERLARRAYADSALPIGDQQTISQPWVVAAICQALELGGGERVLEVGTGSGYSTAILALLAADVLSIERLAGLAADASDRLERLGYGDRVEIRVGDGSLGAPGDAPFDAIAVHASAPAPPPGLLEQLAPGGRLVLPVAEPGADLLVCLTRTADGFDRRPIAPCRFVPLVGEHGFGER
ncbi:MAG: protein-L-isoaspartate(D-aspartate) O-methyltransferase [Solirubrobacterales bacterium]|jgi:protein-L-isoaspartate(D-aspartate) O-methyltransferase|nr:protein-L-isoaspartate(D-aspartate) O-methyltransferase [Solirubrobacterales bacterium]